MYVDICKDMSHMRKYVGKHMPILEGSGAWYGDTK